MADSFGALLRKCRTDAGMSMSELSRHINYSKSHISKIENGLKRPNAMLAKLCDRALDTGGVLAAAVEPTGRRAGDAASGVQAAERAGDDGVWVMELDETGELRFNELPRRQVLAGGASALLGFTLARGARVVTDERTLSGLRASFDQLRSLGTMTSPTVVLGQVVAQVNTLRALAIDTPDPMRSQLLLLASRVAEYAGWMSQEAGAEDAALWWTDRAVRFADAGQDPHMARFALFRRAEIAMYRHDPLRTIELARGAQVNPAAGSRILGLAARCEAQGHALAGDVSAYQQALDRAAALLATALPTTSPVLGSASVPDDIALVRGSCLYDLGRPGEAAEILDREVVMIPVAARRVRARFGARRALAHAQSGNVDQACDVARGVLDDAVQVDSATVRLDLRELARTLSRWHANTAVRELYPDLVATLNAPR